MSNWRSHMSMYFVLAKIIELNHYIFSKFQRLTLALCSNICFHVKTIATGPEFSYNGIASATDWLTSILCCCFFVIDDKNVTVKSRLHKLLHARRYLIEFQSLSLIIRVGEMNDSRVIVFIVFSPLRPFSYTLSLSCLTDLLLISSYTCVRICSHYIFITKCGKRERIASARSVTIVWCSPYNTTESSIFAIKQFANVFCAFVRLRLEIPSCLWCVRSANAKMKNTLRNKHTHKCAESIMIIGRSFVT